MSAATSRLLICSCEKTMPLDAEAIGRGCAAKIGQANQLCGLDLDRFKEALAGGSVPAVVNLFIGPEGGFSPGEAASARERGARLVSLGPLILRTETAGFMAAGALLYELGSSR